MDVDEGLKAYAEQVDSRLNTLLPPADEFPQILHEAMRYSCLAPGKRMRPALCMESSRACGGDPGDALDAGCAVEMVHCFSLIHDDLPAIDNDDFRRGRPTCHKQFGEAAAILAGDALFALAFEVLAAAMPHQAASAITELASSCGSAGLVGGEVLDIVSEGSAVSFELVEQIHLLKTASLISCACVLGALSAKASDGQIAQLRSFGRHLGLAFQIADDILNETSTAAVLGKSAGSDRERGKQTYPAALGVDQAREEAQRFAEQAIADLEGLPGPTDVLANLARFSVFRSV